MAACGLSPYFKGSHWKLALGAEYPGCNEGGVGETLMCGGQCGVRRREGEVGETGPIIGLIWDKVTTPCPHKQPPLMNG